MLAPWLRFEFTSHDLFPIVAFDVEHVHVVHPVHSVIPSKVNDLRIDQTPSCRHPCAWFIATYNWLNPGQGLGVQVENVIELPQLVWLTSKDVNLFVEGNGRVLQTTDRSSPIGIDRPTPFQPIQV